MASRHQHGRLDLRFAGRSSGQSEGLPDRADLDQAALYYDADLDAFMLSTAGNGFLPLQPGIPAPAPAPGTAGDGITDDTLAIQDALNSQAPQGGTVLLTQGDYAVTQLVIPSGVSLQGLSGVELISLNDTGIPLITLAGTVGTSAETLTADATLGATTVSVPSSLGFNAGSYVLIRDNTYFNTVDTAGRNQQIQRIKSTTTNSITFYTPCNSVFQTSQAAEVILIDPALNSHIGGLTLTIPAGKKGGGIYGFLAVNCAIEDCAVSGGREWPAFRLDTCQNTSFKRCQARDAFNPADTTGGAYGFLFNEGCCDCVVESSLSSGVREDLFSNNTYNSRYINNSVRGNRLGTNTHGSACHDILIAGNQIDGNTFDGIVVGSSTAKAFDKNIAIIGNTIRNCGASGIAIGANLTHNEGITIAANEIIDCGVLSASQYGIIVQKTDNFKVLGNLIRSTNGPNIIRSIFAITANDGQIADNQITDAPLHGITLNGCNRVSVVHNRFQGIANDVFRDEGGNTNTGACLNQGDSASVVVGTTLCFGNYPAWGLSSVDITAKGISIGTAAPSFAFETLLTVTDVVTAGMRLNNKSDDPAGAVELIVKSGPGDPASGGLGAFHEAYTNSAYRNRIVLFANSDATGINLDADGAGLDIRLRVGGLGEQVRLDMNGNWLQGTTTALARHAVVGRADQVQSLVRGHTTQTNPAFQVETSAAGFLFGIGGDGKIRTNQWSLATTLGTVTARLPVYGITGALVGYVPVYDTLT